MLKTLLRLVAEKDTMEIAELARNLDVSPALVQHMLEELAHKHYLEAVVPGCYMPCKHCPINATCIDHKQPRIWVLTHKGEKSLDQ